MRENPPNRIGRRRLAAAGTACLLSRCASVPAIDGLTPADIGLHESGKILAKREINYADALQQQYDLQRVLSAAPIVFGNQVTLLSSAREALLTIFQALRDARQSINMEYFIFDNVVLGNDALIDILTGRLRAGVAVNLIYDSFGSRDTPPAFFDTLRQAGAKIVEFNPLDPLKARTGWSPNDRDHRKITVIDGRLGFTGGVNMDKAYENPPSAGVPADGNARHAFWRDTAVRIEGPAVAELQKLFFGTWREQKAPPTDQANAYPPLPRAGVQTIRIIGSAPADKQPLYYASLLTAMQAARHRVWLCSGYFVPPHQEREALTKIARAGIDVRIIAPAFSDVQSAVFASRAAYGDLLEAGARVFEIRDAVVHAKLAVVDDNWSMVGSSNLDRRSVVFNNEVDAVILGHATANQIEGVMRQYMQTAAEIDLAHWRQRSLHERFEELKARVWQYWM